jgi:hypothetical protein
LGYEVIEPVLDHSLISRLESAKGNGRSKKALTTLKIAVLAPMPSASVNMATMLKPGLRRNNRTPYRRSCVRRSKDVHPLISRIASFSKVVFPRVRRAACTASRGPDPAARSSSASRSRCARSSRSRSSSCMALVDILP